MKTVASFFIVLILIGCGMYDSPVSVNSSSSIKGVVRDGDGKALEGVEITTTPTTEAVYSNANGEFEITDVEEGSYQISGNKTDFKNNTITVKVTAGQTSSATLTLEKVLPELQVSSNQLMFGTTSNTMQLTLNNKNQVGDIAYTLSVPGDASWLTLSSPGGKILGEDLAAIVCTVNRNGLQPGNYSTAITVTSNAGNATVQVLMTVVDPTNPQLSVSHTSLNFGTDLTTINFTITNTGKGTLSYTLQSDKSWLTMNRTTADLTASGSSTITVTADRSTLAKNTTNVGTITVTSNGGTTAIPVTVKVSDQGAIAATTLFMKAQSADTARIEWYESSDVANFKSYKLYYSTEQGVTENSTLVGEYTDIASFGTTVKYSDLKKSEFLYFKLYIYDKNGVGTPSNELKVTCPVPMGTYTLVSSTIPNITDVSSVNDNCAWMTTEDGYFYKWNGSSWQKSGVADTALWCVEMVSESEGYAKSAKSLYKFDGSAWNKIASLPAVSGNSNDAMSVVNGNKIFLDAGRYDSLYLYDGSIFVNQGIGYTSDISMYSDTKGAVEGSGGLFTFNGFGWTLSGVYAAQLDYTSDGQLLYIGESTSSARCDVINWDTGKTIYPAQIYNSNFCPYFKAFSSSHFVLISTYYDYELKHVSNGYAKTALFASESTYPTELTFHSPTSGWAWNSSNIYMYR